MEETKLQGTADRSEAGAVLRRGVKLSDEQRANLSVAMKAAWARRKERDAQRKKQEGQGNG